MLHALAAARLDPARSGGCTAPATAPSTPSPRSRGRCSPRLPNAHARTSATAAPSRTTARVTTATGRPAVRGRARRTSTCRATPTRTSAARPRSWRRVAPPSSPLGVDAGRIHTEIFGARAAVTPGIAATPAGPPHPPAGPPGAGPQVTFARSRPDRAVGRRDRQPARARRGLRRPDPLVLPHRRLPHLRDAAALRRGRLRARPGRAARPTATCSSAAPAPTADVVLDL